MLELVRLEITSVPAERGRGRRRPRVAKRKMSGFPAKAREPATAAGRSLRRTRPDRCSRRRAGASRAADPRPRRRAAEEANPRHIGPNPPSDLARARPHLAGQRLARPRRLLRSRSGPGRAPSIAGQLALERVSAQAAVGVLEDRRRRS
jgi:hypothetical protein